MWTLLCSQYIWGLLSSSKEASMQLSDKTHLCISCWSNVRVHGSQVLTANLWDEEWKELPFLELHKGPGHGCQAACMPSERRG